MNIEHSELIWLDEQHEVSLEGLAALSGFSLEELQLLADSDALAPTARQKKNPLKTGNSAANVSFQFAHFRGSNVISS